MQADLVLDDLLGQGLLLPTVCADGSLYTRSDLVRLAGRLNAQGVLGTLALYPRSLAVAGHPARAQPDLSRPVVQALAPATAQHAQQLYAQPPQVFGVHSAIIVGPDGSPQASGADEIHTNARGDARLRLRFHWQGKQLQQQDGNPRPDNRCTRWVRAA
ncbi:hypothetical protein [Comamonas sp. GB3 AK4-5]|uniref:hypothetical protein n=1 Tax=Comamonas sp. GB3 AK4-5 TaxID=3231487 RepID=UPI00351DFE06